MKRVFHLVVNLLCLAAVVMTPAFCLHTLIGSPIAVGAACPSSAHAGMTPSASMPMPPPTSGPAPANRHSCCRTHPQPQPAIGAVHFELPPLAAATIAVTAHPADLSAAASTHQVQELFSPPPPPRLLSRRI